MHSACVWWWSTAAYRRHIEGVDRRAVQGHDTCGIIALVNIGARIKDRPKVEISVSAETESHAESGIRLSAETEITPKETIRFRPKSETETESTCDLSLYPRVRMWT